MTTESLHQKIRQLQGPILILGASGFVGANLFHLIHRVRKDLFGVSSHPSPWRLEPVPPEQIIATDLLIPSSLDKLLDTVKPQTLFDCIAFGGYSFEVTQERIYQTNFNLVVRLLDALKRRNIHRYIHAGSSSEYGAKSAGPSEETLCLPNSHYAVSKVAAANAILHMGQHQGLPCANLRLYSIFGPYEDSSRLIPTLIAKGLQGELPPFVHPDISRDFVYVEDACEAFIDAALNLTPEHYGHSFNIGSGRRVTIQEVADMARKLF
ncbi:MAG: NAD-dependent epimerase/dehydratase family protein, partial [Magnetococcales bacterium]|nr:NAD-dependent epimerase/dehydratase family protein [Magnetococcales bacterium]